MKRVIMYDKYWEVDRVYRNIKTIKETERYIILIDENGFTKEFDKDCWNISEIFET